MKKEIIYTYLGTNGTVATPVFIEGAYSVKKIRLIADFGKALTKDFGATLYYNVLVPEIEVENWLEIDDPGQND